MCSWPKYIHKHDTLDYITLFRTTVKKQAVLCFKTHLLAITIEQIHVQLVTFFVAGVHTSFINQLKSIV